MIKIVAAGLYVEKILILSFILLLVVKGITYFDLVPLPEPSWTFVFTPLIIDMILAAGMYFLVQKLIRGKK
jgi:hypothetical protein